MKPYILQPERKTLFWKKKKKINIQGVQPEPVFLFVLIFFTAFLLHLEDTFMISSWYFTSEVMVMPWEKTDLTLIWPPKPLECLWSREMRVQLWDPWLHLSGICRFCALFLQCQCTQRPWVGAAQVFLRDKGRGKHSLPSWKRHPWRIA